MPKVSNKDIYAQDPSLDMEDYLLGTNNNTTNKKTQTYSLGSIFSLFYNFLGYNAFLFTTDTDTYPIASPGCFFAFDEHDEITSDFQQARKLTFSSNDTYNFNVTEYLQMLVDSDKFLFKLINLEDKNNFIFLKPSNFTLSNTLTSFDVNIEIQYGLSNGNFVNYKKYLLLLEFDANTFNPADYDLTDFTNTSGNPFITAQDLTDALALLPTPITNHSGLNLDDGTNPHGTTKSDVGLGNVPNLDTTDAVNNSHSHSNKSILDLITEPFTTSLKSLYDGAVTNINNLLLTGQRLITSSEITKLNNTSGTNTGDETTLSIQTKRPLKTIEGQSLEGIGNIDLTKNDVGLSNVDNTSDIDKPISTAAQTALDTKLDKDTTAGVERTYIINTDGSQGVKDTSDFKDVLEFANLAAFPAIGESSKIYVALDTNLQYRWSGSAYVQIGGGGGSGLSNFIHEYVNPNPIPFTGTISAIEIYKFKILANTFSSVDRAFFRQIHILKYNSVTAVNDFVSMHISTDGVFSPSLPELARFTITQNARNDLYLGNRFFIIRNGKIEVFRPSGAGVNTDIGQNERWLVNFNPTVDNWIHFSVILGGSNNGVALSSLILTK